MSLRTKLIRLAHTHADLRPHLLPLLREAAVQPTVDGFLMILSGLVTQQDIMNKKKPAQYNPNALAMYLGVVNKVRAKLKSSLESSEPADLQAMKAAVAQGFTPDFPPAKKFQKIVDEYITTGRTPKYPVDKKTWE